MKAKVRGKLRNVSPAMARVLRRRGIKVHSETADPVIEAVKAVMAIVNEPPINTTLMPAEPLRRADFDLSDEELDRLTAPES